MDCHAIWYIHVPHRMNANNFVGLKVSSSAIIRSKVQFVQYFGL